MCAGWLIAYRIGKVEHRLITTAFDRRITPEKFARVYHWLWDIEMCHDEMKVHLMTVRHGKAQTVFRSKSHELVEQEFWAMLSAHNLAVIADYLLLIQQAPTGVLLRLHGLHHRQEFAVFLKLDISTRCPKRIQLLFTDRVIDGVQCDLRRYLTLNSKADG